MGLHKGIATVASQGGGGWGGMEFRDADFGDLRLRKRLASVADCLADRPQDSINRASGDWAAAKAAYRFFDNEQVSPEGILEPHRNRTIERIGSLPWVLAVQDTTFLNYANLKIDGLGFMGGQKELGDRCRGFLVHTTLAIDPQGHGQGIPLGILHQKIWSRKTIRDPKKQTGEEPLESSKWAEAVPKAAKSSRPSKIVHVADREGDVLEFMKEATAHGQHFLIRASRDRALADVVSNQNNQRIRLWDWMDNRKATFEYELEIKPDRRRFKVYKSDTKRQGWRTADIPERVAKIQVRVDQVRLALGKKPSHGGLEVTAIYLKEKDPPDELVALEWMLLTSVQAHSESDIREKIHWYKMRWHIENFHKMLKSGCTTEACRLEDIERLKKFIALNSIVAWRLYWISRVGRADLVNRCDQVLAEHEWQALYMKVHKKKPPNDPPPLADAMLWIAKLGGFLGRKNDGHPGVKSMWLGWQRLTDCADSWLVFKTVNNCG